MFFMFVLNMLNHTKNIRGNIFAKVVWKEILMIYF